jgi:hypothetical protein
VRRKKPDLDFVRPDDVAHEQVAAVEATASEQSESWTHGKRVATPNLTAQTMTFTRASA